MRKESVVVKIPVSMIRYMDAKVAAGEFSSRNDLVRHALRWNIEYDLWEGQDFD